jgi:uracil-DNA glycosylase family protein
MKSMNSKKNISAADFIPNRPTLSALQKAAQTCRGCSLYKKATQTVFGIGSPNASVIVVGEIPGDKEDVEGEPFVGPAGKFLRSTIEKTALDFEDIYFTNVVKHFKFIYSNKKRLHRSPVSSEIKACRPWLDTEIKVISPKIIVCLGSVAAKTLIDKKFLITKQRGKWFNYSEECKIIVTFHPSAILRAPDETARHTMKALFLKDLKKIGLFLTKRR